MMPGLEDATGPRAISLCTTPAEPMLCSKRGHQSKSSCNQTVASLTRSRESPGTATKTHIKKGLWHQANCDESPSGSGSSRGWELGFWERSVEQAGAELDFVERVKQWVWRRHLMEEGASRKAGKWASGTGCRRR